MDNFKSMRSSTDLGADFDSFQDADLDDKALTKESKPKRNRKSARIPGLKPLKGKRAGIFTSGQDQITEDAKENLSDSDTSVKKSNRKLTKSRSRSPLEKSNNPRHSYGSTSNASSTYRSSDCGSSLHNGANEKKILPKTELVLGKQDSEQLKDYATDIIKQIKQMEFTAVAESKYSLPIL